jgi:hypothetical protein
MCSPGRLFRHSGWAHHGGMFEKRKKQLVVLALVLGGGGVVYGAETAMSKDGYKTAQQRVETQAKVQRKACGRFQGNAKDVCEAKAKGWEKIAKAELATQFKPGPEAEKMAKFAHADADYGVAKQRCGALKDRAHDRCVDKAKHDHEAAIRLAKVEKVQEVNAIKRAAQEEHVPQQKPEPKT